MTRTNAFTLLCMLIRVVALFVAASSLLRLPAAWINLRAQIGWEAIAMPVLATTLLTLLLMVLLWIFADKLARLALVRPHEQTFECDTDPKVLLGLAISVIGAWFLCVGLKDLMYLVPRWLMISRMTAGNLTLDNGLEEVLPEGTAILGELVLGAVLLLRGPGLAGVVHRLRYGRLAG